MIPRKFRLQPLDSSNRTLTWTCEDRNAQDFSGGGPCQSAYGACGESGEPGIGQVTKRGKSSDLVVTRKH